MSAIPTPPRLPRVLLRRALPADLRDAVDGDLHELYAARRAASGAAAAAAWYWLETLSFVMRFSLDRVARGMRAIASGAALPSALDLKLGARMLAKSPGLALVGGLGMAVAVALGTAAYAVVNSYFYPSLPLHEGDRVVALGKFDRRQGSKDEQLLYDFLAWRRELRSVVDLGAFRTIRRNFVSGSGEGDPILLAEMTASGFRVARIPPLLGRTLLDADEQPGAPEVVVIGYDAWQSRFGGDPAVVGREIRLGRDVHTVVGVMPPAFTFPVNDQYWVPLRVDTFSSLSAGPRVRIAPATGPELYVFGRLAPGATKESAQAELSVLGRRLAAEGPPERAHLEARIDPYTHIIIHSDAEDQRRMYAVLRFLIALLLGVVAMNVAVLVYARTVTRAGEIAVRTALGATRGRIVGQLFAEAFVLSALSALVGLGIVAVGLRMFDQAIAEAFDGRAPFWMRPGLSFGTVLFALAMAVLAAIIVGVLPALRATGAQLRAAMGSLGSGARARLGPTWTALIVAEIAIAVALLPPAMYKGALTLRIALQPPGFAAGEYLSTQFLVERDAQAGSDSLAERAAADSAHAIVTELLTRLANEPGVVGTTVTIGPPWEGGGGTIDVEGVDQPPQRVRVATVDTSYFGLFGVRAVAGRAFAPADAALPRADRPVIVNRSFVTERLGEGDPIGRRIRYRSYGDEENPWITIAGVVEDFPAGVKTSGDMIAGMMYHLEAPGESRSAMLTIRLRGQTQESFMPTLRRIATSVDPMLQLSRTSTLDALHREYARAGAQLAIFVALTVGSVLLLSAAGIHALMSVTVNQRRREIGIRAALGAPRRRILASVLARAARQLALGVGIGLGAAVAVERLSGGEMMNGTGLLLVPGTAAFMLVVGLLAAAGPARRGLSVQPTEALRAE
ncbi:MAG TPA: ABC transporter permease [Gemmatimonadaceae bacterium]|nr:ABC transporter permease [Gemmatimonadaceae bacterium]